MATIAREREADIKAFLTAHREGIGYAKANRDKVIELLKSKFGHWPLLAEKTFHEYLGYMDESLQIDMLHLGKLVAQVVPDQAADARQIASEWAIPGAVKA